MEFAKENMVAVSKKVLHDDNLSFKARGIWVGISILPDPTKILLSELEKQSCEGRGTLLSGINELVKHGYLIKDTNFRKIGRYVPVLSEICQLHDQDMIAN